MSDRVRSRPGSGFSLIEFMMILAVATILLSSIDAWLSEFKTRGKVAEALAVAETAKFDILVTCSADPALDLLAEEFLGHRFPHSPYVDSIAVTGSCQSPRIELQTVNTGLIIDPTLTIAGDLSKDIARWTCKSTGLEIDKPHRCRDS